MVMPSNSVYLDSNVIIDLDEGRLDELKSKMLCSVKAGSTIFPFSGAQIDEVTNNPLTDRCMARLDLLSKLSNNTYYRSDIYGHGFCVEEPISVWNTINEVLSDFDSTKLFTELVPFEAIKKSRDQLGLDPLTLNNLPGDQAASTIDRAISDSIPDGVAAPRSIREISDAVAPVFREQIRRSGRALGPMKPT